MCYVLLFGWYTWTSKDETKSVRVLAEPFVPEENDPDHIVDEEVYELTRKNELIALRNELFITSEAKDFILKLFLILQLL